MSTLKYLLVNVVKHQARVHQLYFCGASLQERVKNVLFVNLDSRYADNFPEYSSYFGRVLMLLKSMYGMTNSVKLFSDELIEWLNEAFFIQYQLHMSIYYMYAPDGTNIVVISYVDNCVYWYKSEALGKFSVDTIGNIFHVNFLGYAHWFMSIRISYMKDNFISVDQSRYSTSVLGKYLYTVTVKTSTKFYKTTLPSDMIFTKAYASTSNK